jgi:hypothetical protein
MRVLLKASIPAQSGTAAIRDGTMPQILEQLLTSIKPEASYFLPENGRRTMYLFFDLKDPSQLPAISEPLFSGLGADVTVTPAMNADDLRKGLQAVASTSARSG